MEIQKNEASVKSYLQAPALIDPLLIGELKMWQDEGRRGRKRGWDAGWGMGDGIEPTAAAKDLAFCTCGTSSTKRANEASKDIHKW